MKIEIFKSLRKPESHARYLEFVRSVKLPKCYLCESKPIREYKHWKIVENQFPYDEVAETTHMVTPKHHSKEPELTAEEIEELKKVKEDIHKEYDMILENAHKNKLIPGHYHLHLLILKEQTMVMRESEPQDKVNILARSATAMKTP
ncbi:MAG: hypothetical protein KGJ35_00475 [Patescibacteria group bacterium]|nr:hypothetical protein [Patescibacteria group bacterium]